jgi:hypothetical protein
VKLSGLLRVAGNALTVGGIAIDRSSNPAITPSGVTLLDGQRVKVFGGAIQNNTLVATAIRVKAFKKSFADFRLRGVVSSVTGTTFVIYGITVDASAVTALPTITVGRAYWVRGVYTASADNANNGTLKASEVKTSSDDAVKMSELKGSITDYVSNASFRVRGVLVDASAVSGLSGLANGQFVEVTGSVVDGVVKAISVESKSAATGNELEITDVVAALNTNAKTFNLGSQAVNYASAVFEDGSASDLLDGKLLEVEGRLNGSTLVARKIEFKGSNGTATQSREDREVEGRLPVSATASGEIVSFSVNGVSLTCTQASVGAACRTSVLVRGAEVEVRYTGSAAPFTATRLKRED